MALLKSYCNILWSDLKRHITVDLSTIQRLRAPTCIHVNAPKLRLSCDIWGELVSRLQLIPKSMDVQVSYIKWAYISVYSRQSTSVDSQLQLKTVQVFIEKKSHKVDPCSSKQSCSRLNCIFNIIFLMLHLRV